MRACLYFILLFASCTNYDDEISTLNKSIEALKAKNTVLENQLKSNTKALDDIDLILGAVSDNINILRNEVKQNTAKLEIKIDSLHDQTKNDLVRFEEKFAAFSEYLTGAYTDLENKLNSKTTENKALILLVDRTLKKLFEINANLTYAGNACLTSSCWELRGKLILFHQSSKFWRVRNVLVLKEYIKLLNSLMEEVDSKLVTQNISRDEALVLKYEMLIMYHTIKYIIFVVEHNVKNTPYS